MAAYLDRRRIYYTSTFLETCRDGKLGNDRLAGRRMRRDENTLIALNTRSGDVLERIKVELVTSRRGIQSFVLSNRDIRVVWRQSDLAISYHPNSRTGELT